MTLILLFATVVLVGRYLPNVPLLLTTNNFSSDPGTLPIPNEACRLVYTSSESGYYKYHDGISYMAVRKEMRGQQTVVWFERELFIADSPIPANTVSWPTRWEGSNPGRLWECTNIEMAAAMEAFAAAYYRVQHPETLVLPISPWE